MTDWLVEIEFDSEDREALEQLLSGTEVALVTSDGLTFLSDPALKTIEDADAAKAAAERMVRQIRAVVQVISGRSGPTAGRLFWRQADGTPMTSVASTLTATYNILADADFTEWGVLVVATRTSGSVARVLDIAGRGVTQLDWHGLYVLLDAIGDDVGKEQSVPERGWASKKQLDLFRRTANSYEALGDEARHGHARARLPRPMQLGEARRLLLQVMREWLEWHREQLS